MKAKVLCTGFDGANSYSPGDEYEGNGDWIKRCLANGLAEPIDAAAEAFVADAKQMRRHASPALTQAAERRARKAQDAAR